MKREVIIPILVVAVVVIGGLLLRRPPAPDNSMPAPVSSYPEASFPDAYANLQKPVGPEPNQYTELRQDLNGDGVPESIGLTIRKEDPAEPLNPSHLATLTVNGMSTTTPGDSPEGYFGIVDLNAQDTLKEIAVMDEGPSSDYTTTFYAYDGKNIIDYGTISGIYREMQFDGKGKVTTRTRAKILDTWFYYDDYVLSGHRLVHKPREFYERQGTTDITALVPLPLQRSPEDKTIVTTLKKGEAVRIVGCDDIAWCMAENSAGIRGWFAIQDFDLIKALSLHASEVFTGLSNAD